MALNRFQVSTGALLALCLVLSVVSVPAPAYYDIYKEEREADFLKIARSVKFVFSAEVLQCPSKTKDEVSECLRIVVDLAATQSPCNFLTQYNGCVVEGLHQCANGNAAEVIYNTVVEKNLKFFGCAVPPVKVNSTSDGAELESRTLRKREAEGREAEISESEIMEAVINQLASTIY